MSYIRNAFSLILGSKTLVSFSVHQQLQAENLPAIQEGILHPSDTIQPADTQLIAKLNLLYAREYSIFKDLHILWKGWKKLDR
jgi:hypothetical protein